MKSKTAVIIASFFLISTPAHAGDLITFNDNAGWCWYQDERAIVQNHMLIMGSVADAAGTNGSIRDGNIEVTTYDIINGGLPQRFVLHEHLQADDHDLPAFLPLPDGKILALYSKHSSDRLIRARITTFPGDTMDWQPEVRIERSSSVCYSNLFQLSAENNRIYDFYRGENYNPNFIISDDNGRTWQYGGHLIRKDGQRPYVKYASNNTDTIHFIATEGHPRNYDNSIYHGYLYNSTVYRSDGTRIKDVVADGPVNPEQLTRVFPGDVNNVAWTTDLHLDANGRPYMAFSVQKDGAGLAPGQGGYDHRYYYGRWDGSQWHVHEMAYAGTKLYAGEDDYTGLVALNPQDPNVVYISTDADPYTGTPLISSVDNRRHYELFQGTTRDWGTTWTWAFITRDSTVDNLRPVVPIWDDPNTILLWTRGTLTTFTNYDLDLVGLINPKPIDPNLPRITEISESQHLMPGQTAIFEISVQSPLPVSYQWYKVIDQQQVLEVGTNEPNLIIENVQQGDQGQYYCVVKNDAGNMQSGIMRLVVGQLLAHWPLDEDFRDISGNGFDAQAHGSPVLVDGGISDTPALQLDGASYLECGNNAAFDLSPAGSICAWVKTDELTNQWASIVGKGRWSWRLCRYSETSTGCFHINTSIGEINANGSLPIVDNQWHLVIATYDGDSLNLYIDGQLDVSAPSQGMINQTNDPVYIGNRSDADRYWTGLIDDVRLYSHALTLEQIQSLYQNGTLTP